MDDRVYPEWVRPVARRTVFALWSIFREFSWWADNAGPMPKSFVVAGRLLGATLSGVGTYWLVGGPRLFGLAMLFLGAGLVLGTFELQSPRD